MTQPNASHSRLEGDVPGENGRNVVSLENSREVHLSQAQRGLPEVYHL